VLWKRPNPACRSQSRNLDVVRPALLPHRAGAIAGDHSGRRDGTYLGERSAVCIPDSSLNQMTLSFDGDKKEPSSFILIKRRVTSSVADKSATLLDFRPGRGSPNC
jgi:hypothetical protein